MPTRENVLIEPIPVRIICELASWVEVEEFKDRIRSASLERLVIYKDSCVYPSQCRFFSLELDNEPYFSRSLPVNVNPFGHGRIGNKCYITKECALRVQGFRGITSRCPFKAGLTLTFEEKTKSNSCNAEI